MGVEDPARSRSVRASIIHTAAAMRNASRLWRREGKSVGLVPTMGALHAGHLSLVAAARDENDMVVVSVFVNPLQFGPNEDFDRYPRDWERDLKLLEEAEVDAVYRPSVEAMYPPDSSTRVHVAGLTDSLEGAARPGHFDGVATVVTKLFTAVEPDTAYFGQKDAQQVAVVRRLIRDLDLGVEVRAVPTVREPDGLALSSRNVYLAAEERKAAASISAALREAASAYAAGEHDQARLRALMAARLGREPLVEPDYVELVDAATFQKPGTLAVIAARVGKTRLIDNHDVAKPFPGQATFVRYN
jgi:pantoate--beta-alanine ligase